MSCYGVKKEVMNSHFSNFDPTLTTAQREEIAQRELAACKLKHFSSDKFFIAIVFIAISTAAILYAIGLKFWIGNDIDASVPVANRTIPESTIAW